jgi:hypothetical protein
MLNPATIHKHSLPECKPFPSPQSVIAPFFGALGVPCLYILIYTLVVNSGAWYAIQSVLSGGSEMYALLREKGFQYECTVGGTWVKTFECQILSGLNLIFMHLCSDLGHYIARVGNTDDKTGSLVIVGIIYKALCAIPFRNILQTLHSINMAVYTIMREGVSNILMWYGH